MTLAQVRLLSKGPKLPRGGQRSQKRIAGGPAFVMRQSHGALCVLTDAPQDLFTLMNGSSQKLSGALLIGAWTRFIVRPRPTQSGRGLPHYKSWRQ
jgi:hypothetical protein